MAAFVLLTRVRRHQLRCLFQVVLHHLVLNPTGGSVDVLYAAKLGVVSLQKKYLFKKMREIVGTSWGNTKNSSATSLNSCASPISSSGEQPGAFTVQICKKIFLVVYFYRFFVGNTRYYVRREGGSDLDVLHVVLAELLVGLPGGKSIIIKLLRGAGHEKTANSR